MKESPTPEAKPKRGFARRWGKRLAIAAVFAAPVYLAVGFYVLPWAIVRFGLPIASEFVDGRIELDELRLNPLAFSGSVEGLRIFDRDDVKVLEVQSARGGVSPRSVWLTDGVLLDAVEVEGPFARLVLREDGTLNLVDLFPASEESEPRTEPLDLRWLPRFRLGGVEVRNGVFEFEDRLVEGATPRRFDQITLTVGPLDTESTAATPYLARVRSDLGEAADVEGALTLDPLKVSGKAAVAGIGLAAYQPYFGYLVPLALAGGNVEANASWSLDLTPGAREAVARVDRVAVTGFRLEDPAGGVDEPLVPAPLVAFDRFELGGLSANAVSQRAELEGLQLREAELTVERDADGTLPVVTAINEAVRRVNQLVADLTPPADSAAEPAAPLFLPLLPPPLDAALAGIEQLFAEATDPAATWTAGVGQVELLAARARWSDSVPPGGAVLGLHPVDASAGPFDTAKQLTIPFKSTLRVDQASAQTVAATPGGADAGNVDAAVADRPEESEAARSIREQIAAESGLPTDADLGRGLITAEGQLHLEDPLAEVTVVVRGLDLTGANPYLALYVPGLRMESSSIDLRMSPRIRPNRGALPVAVEDALIRMGGSVTARYGPEGTAPLTIPVTGLAMEFGPLNTQSPVPGQLTFDAVVAGGEVGVVGYAVPRPLRPLESDVEVEVGVSGLELAPLSPLASPYLGRAIESGQLFMAMPVRLANGRFQSTVPISIEQFKLGGKVDETGAARGGGGGALGVPIDLVVAVLKGPSGTMVFPPTPLDFNLLDNTLNLPKAISGAFLGMLRGIAAQPLKILGSVASGETAGQVADGLKNAAGNVTDTAGSLGRGAGDVANAAGDAAGALFRGLGDRMGGGGGEAPAEALDPNAGVLRMPVPPPSATDPASPAVGTGPGVGTSPAVVGTSPAGGAGLTQDEGLVASGDPGAPDAPAVSSQVANPATPADPVAIPPSTAAATATGTPTPANTATADPVAEDAGIIQGITFEPGTARFTRGAAEALDRFAEILKARGLGLALTPTVDPAIDGPALLQARARLAAGGMAAARVESVEATPVMLRNLALRRARATSMYVRHVLDGSLRLPENAVELRPTPEQSAADPSSAWITGPPGVLFELVAP